MSQDVIEFLDWDSRFFNQKIGRVYGGKLRERVKEQNYDVLYVFFEEDITINGYKKSLEQTKVIFSKKKLGIHHMLTSNIVSVLGQESLKKDLYALAYESGKYSRFLKDKYFGKHKFQELYKKWVDNAIDGNFADDVLVYMENLKIIGFVSYQIKNNYGQIGLIAVDSSAQGKGIGTKLIAFAEEALSKKGVHELRIPTQLENKLACKFYTKLGYSIIEKEYIQHFWNYDTIQ